MKKWLLLFLLFVPILSFSADITDNVNTYNYGLQVSLSNLFMNGNIDLNNKDIVNGGIFYGTATNANLLDGIDSAVLARLDQSNTFAGGKTQAMDGATVTNLTMRGNIDLGSGYLSGDGDNEGVSVASGGNVTASGSIRMSGQLTGSGDQMFNAVNLYQYSTNFSVPPYFAGYTAGGTKASPTAVTANKILFFVSGRGYTGTGFSGSKALMYFYTAENWTTNANGTYLQFTTTPNLSTTIKTAMQIREDRAVRLYNMTTAPTTGSGYGVIAATNNEMYVWDGAGNRTLLSPHEDENNELVTRSDNPYTGLSEEINLTRLAQAVEELLPKDHALKGKIYKRIQVEATADWRANEKRQAAEREAERAQWDQADTAYKAEVAKWAAIPLADKARLTQPTKQDDQPKPEPYTVRPIPTWAAEAQKRFDSKHVEAAK